MKYVHGLNLIDCVKFIFGIGSVRLIYPGSPGASFTNMILLRYQHA